MAVLNAHQELYCVVPSQLEKKLLVPLRAAFADLGIKVVVERRDTKRRVSYDIQRQRAMHLPRTLPDLPSEAAPYAEELRLLQRMPSAGLELADEPLSSIVEMVAQGDGVAATELVWRINNRVYCRLQHNIGDVAAQTAIEPTLGRILDRIDECDVEDEGAILAWVDDVVDDRHTY